MSNPDPINDPENTLPEDIDTNDEDAKTDQYIEDRAFGLTE